MAEIQKVYENGTRYYLTPTGKYPSVTSIMGATKSARDYAILDNWRKKVGYAEANRISRDACSRGLIIHQAIESYSYDKNKAHIEALQRIKTYGISSFYSSSKQVFDTLTRVEIIATETSVYSTLYKYAGTFDMLLKQGGDLILVDWKTCNSKKLREYCEEYFMQLAAYSQCIRELMPDLLPNRLTVVAIYQDAPPDRYSVSGDEITEYLGMFLERLSMYNEKAEDKASSAFSDIFG